MQKKVEKQNGFEFEVHQSGTLTLKSFDYIGTRWAVIRKDRPADLQMGIEGLGRGVLKIATYEARNMEGVKMFAAVSMFQATENRYSLNVFAFGDKGFVDLEYAKKELSLLRLEMDSEIMAVFDSELKKAQRSFRSKQKRF